MYWCSTKAEAYWVNIIDPCDDERMLHLAIWSPDLGFYFFYDATSTTVVAIRAPTIVFVPSPQYIHNVVEYKNSGLLNMILDGKVLFTEYNSSLEEP